MKLHTLIKEKTIKQTSGALSGLLKMTPDAGVHTVRGTEFWSSIDQEGNLDSFFNNFLSLPKAVQTNALLNPLMWQTLEPRLKKHPSERINKNALSLGLKNNIETIIRNQTDDIRHYLFLMPAFLQMLSLNEFHTDYMLAQKKERLFKNIVGTPQERQIYKSLFKEVFNSPEGQELLKNGITCFQTKYGFDNTAHFSAHWCKDKKECRISKIHSPPNELENDKTLLKYTATYLYHELVHMSQYDCGYGQNNPQDLFMNFVAYRLLELETAVTGAITCINPSLTKQETPENKLYHYYMNKYMQWLIQKNGGDEKKAKTQFAKHLWSNSADPQFADILPLKKCFTSWNEKYNLLGIKRIDGTFQASVDILFKRLYQRGINVSTDYFLNSHTMCLSVHMPSNDRVQGYVFNILKEISNSQKDQTMADRFLSAALKMTKAPQMTDKVFLTRTFDQFLTGYRKTRLPFYLTGLKSLFTLENGANDFLLKKAKNIPDFKAFFKNENKSLAFGLNPKKHCGR